MGMGVDTEKRDLFPVMVVVVVVVMIPNKKSRRPRQE